MMIRPMMSATQLSPMQVRSLKVLRLVGTMALLTGLLSGCVSSEKYEAEKARALNFQRLLAQEEKRTGEVNVKFQEAQRELGTLQSETRDLTSELDAMRDQFTSTQEELTRLREGKMADVKSDDLTLAEPSISEFGLEDIEFKDSDFADIGADLGGDSMASGSMDSAMASGSADTHTVSKGDTLYSISRRYAVSVGDIKDWNNLSSNLISPGQKLRVSRP
ncbi:MAG: LysM peptidoglycan-binding domain-containing protein [Nitrospirales bacterium]